MAVVSPEKKTNPSQPTSLQETAPVFQVHPIRLKPSSSDYATAAKTTADAMGLTGPAASKSKPSERLLWLTSAAS